MGTNAPASAIAMINELRELLKVLTQLEEKEKVLNAQIRLSSAGNLEGARTVKEFNDSIKDFLDLMRDVGRDRAKAAGQRQSVRLSRQLRRRKHLIDPR